jgi:hypothetical protein
MTSPQSTSISFHQKKRAVTKTFVTPDFTAMGAAEKKRPRGLKGVAAQKAAKKAKTENEEEKTQTVILDKEVEEGDELGEVEALYESAKDKLGMSIICSGFMPYFKATLT